MFDGDRAAVQSFFLERRRQNAASVVGDIDDDVHSFAVNFQFDFSRFRFADQAAHFRFFDAVRDGVSQKMQKRFDQRIENLRVNFELLAVNYQLDLFAVLLGGYASRALETIAERAERDHSQTQKFVLHFFNQTPLTVEKHFEISAQVFEFVIDGESVAGRLYKLARRLVKFGVTVEFERVEIQG